ncbi:hypothetical protein [Bradyrhizobium pachyrhizi]|uniref:hypothetical protein n=1 Tax=Bradyrhizobium pachyrhizi TaxID=280333 RepID=UPI003D3693E6
MPESQSDERKRRYRKRRAAGRMVLGVETGAEHVDMLVRSEWLPRRDVYSRGEIKAALQAMIDDAAKK